MECQLLFAAGDFQHFLEQNPGWRLTFHNYHSRESYDYVDQGLIDLAVISDDMYHPNVETIPAFREPMVLITSPKSCFHDQVQPAQLDPSKELRCPGILSMICGTRVLVQLRGVSSCGAGPDVRAGAVSSLG